MKIAFIGTGLMGKPMAQRLLAGGYKLNVFNRNTLKTEQLCAKGAKLCWTPSEAVKDSEVVITMLADYFSVCQLLCSCDKNDLRNKTVIQMSTISPDESLILKERIESIGGEYMEAPVLGSVPQAGEGSLIIMVGSTTGQFEKFSKLLSVLGSKVTHFGEVGKASAVKLAFNQMIAGMMTSFASSIGYLKQNGIDTNLFIKLLRGSALYAPTFDRKLSNLLNREFDNTHFPLKHMLKDLNLIIGQFGQAGINTKILEAIKMILVECERERLSDKDYTVFYNIIYPDK